MKRRARRSSAPKPSPTRAELGARVNRLERSLVRERARRKALEHAVKDGAAQQAAANEILRVISSSSGDAQPVFDAIARSAVRLCGASFSAVFRVHGGVVSVVAHHNLEPDTVALLKSVYPAPVNPDTLVGRVVLGGVAVHHEDVWTADVPPASIALARRQGLRTLLNVPMVRDGQVVGVIAVARAAVAPFSDSQITLIETFADQAVIAIENARLFTELGEKNRALTEALEQQTATGQILGVISNSQTDVGPVFDTIAASSVRLCGGMFGAVFRLDGELVHLAAHANFSPEALGAFQRTYPLEVSRDNPLGRAIVDGRIVHIPDVEEVTEYSDASKARARAIGYRALLAVPMLQDGLAIGAIGVGMAEPGSFSDRHIDLLVTFADQAVIAIENVRLFTELQEKNGALTEAHAQVTKSLSHQTATSDILRVISSSPTSVEPVFESIVHSSVRLLGGLSGVLMRVVGDEIHLAALTSTSRTGDDAVRAMYPIPRSAVPAWQAVDEQRPLVIEDTETDPRLPERAREMTRARGVRSQLLVPMVRDAASIGLVVVTRATPGGFTADEIDLLKTFADQAVIAIENVRLFTELQQRTRQLTRSVDELTALGEVSRAVSSTLDLETVLTTIVTRANELCGTDGAGIYEFDVTAGAFHLRATKNFSDELIEASRTAPLRHGEGIMGRLAETRQPMQIPDITVEGAYQSRVRDILIRNGYRALLSVPLLRDDALIGALTVGRRTPGEFAADVVELLRTFAAQSSLAIQNARLFHELESKSRELEVASQHKSEFLASMSHELRTPLNAVIGFSDVLLEQMFGEVNEKQAEYLRDILASGKHLLSLINDILDLSKIEAGRMELDVTAFDLPTAIDNALTLMRERAGRRGIALGHVVDERLGEIRADERKMKQVLLNLLSNAVKFTPGGGRIDVRAALVDGTAEISVTDTGIGIAPDDHAAVFEEFRQVGRADRKAEGTGLGLALCRKFVELHGGRIWLKSEVGHGSTFTFTLPLAGPVSDRGH